MMRLKGQGARPKGQGSRGKVQGVLFSLLLVPFTLLLVSCGFHPRGELALPPGAARIFLTGVAPSSPLAHEIARLYTRAGGTVVDRREEAEAVLDILGESNDRRVAAVNSAGLVSQYELYYGLRFRLLDLRGEIIHAENAVGVTRSYAFDPNNVLGKAQEESLLRDDMRQQAINQMLRRLARGTHLNQSSEAPAPAVTEPTSIPPSVPIDAPSDATAP